MLQTLALIQRAADQPPRVVQLARAQERELRAWLFDGDLPGAVVDGVASVAAGARQIAEEVESAPPAPAIESPARGVGEERDGAHAMGGAVSQETKMHRTFPSTAEWPCRPGAPPRPRPYATGDAGARSAARP